MGRNYRRNINENIDVKPQKFNWKSHKIFDDFKSADLERSKLIKSGKEFVKVRRCGPDGIKFKIKIGHPLKIKKAEETNEE